MPRRRRGILAAALVVPVCGCGTTAKVASDPAQDRLHKVIVSHSALSSTLNQTDQSLIDEYSSKIAVDDWRFAYSPSAFVRYNVF
jgi:hypothetical protein